MEPALKLWWRKSKAPFTPRCLSPAWSATSSRPGSRGGPTSGLRPGFSDWFCAGWEYPGTVVPGHPDLGVEVDRLGRREENDGGLRRLLARPSHQFAANALSLVIQPHRKIREIGAEDPV